MVGVLLVATALAGSLSVHEHLLHLPLPPDPEPVGDPTPFLRVWSFKGDGSGPDLSVASEFGPLAMECGLRGRQVRVFVEWIGGAYPSRLPEVLECEVGKNHVRVRVVPLPPLYTKSELTVDPAAGPVEVRRYNSPGSRWSQGSRRFFLPAGVAWDATVQRGQPFFSTMDEPLKCGVEMRQQKPLLVVSASGLLGDGLHTCQVHVQGEPQRVEIQLVSAPFPEPGPLDE